VPAGAAGPAPCKGMLTAPAAEQVAATKSAAEKIVATKAPAPPAQMRRACSVAIVGGGLAGLSCANQLLRLLPHAQATVFDMGRSGPGADCGLCVSLAMSTLRPGIRLRPAGTLRPWLWCNSGSCRICMP